jgi:hypothetical protein
MKKDAAKFFQPLVEIIQRSIRKPLPEPKSSTWMHGSDDAIKYYTPEQIQDNGPLGPVLKFKVPDKWIKEFKDSIPELRKKVVLEVPPNKDISKEYSSLLAASLLPRELQEYISPFKFSIPQTTEDNHTGDWRKEQIEIVKELGKDIGEKLNNIWTNHNNPDILENARKLKATTGFKSSEALPWLFRYFLLSVYQAHKLTGEDFRNGQVPEGNHLKSFTDALKDAGSHDLHHSLSNLLYMTNILNHNEEDAGLNKIQKDWEDKEAKAKVKELSGALKGVVDLSDKADPAFQKKIVTGLRLLPDELLTDLNKAFKVKVDDTDHKGNTLPSSEKVFKDHSVYTLSSKAPAGGLDDVWRGIGRSIYNHMYQGLADHKRMAANDKLGGNVAPIEKVFRKLVYNNYNNPFIQELRKKSPPEIEYYKYTKPAELSGTPKADMFLPSMLLGEVFKVIMNNVVKSANSGSEGAADEHLRHMVFENTLNAIDRNLPGAKDVFTEILGKYFKV